VLAKTKCAVCVVGIFSSNFDVLHNFPHYAQLIYTFNFTGFSPSQALAMHKFLKISLTYFTNIKQTKTHPLRKTLRGGLYTGEIPKYSFFGRSFKVAQNEPLQLAQNEPI